MNVDEKALNIMESYSVIKDGNNNMIDERVFVLSVIVAFNVMAGKAKICSRISIEIDTRLMTRALTFM